MEDEIICSKADGCGGALSCPSDISFCFVEELPTSIIVSIQSALSFDIDILTVILCYGCIYLCMMCNKIHITAIVLMRVDNDA